MRKNKKNNRNEKPQLVLDTHFMERLKLRFEDVKLDDVDTIIQHSKKYTVKNLDSCPFQVVKNKLKNPEYPNSLYLVNSRFNMIMVSVNNVIMNVLYLDGRDGYNIA